MHFRFYRVGKRILTVVLTLLILLTVCAFDAPPNKDAQNAQSDNHLTNTNEEPPDEEPPKELPDEELGTLGLHDAQSGGSKYDGRLFVQDEVLVKFHSKQNKSSMARTLSSLDCKIANQISDNLVRTDLPKDESIERFIEKLEAQPEVAYAQPNYIYQLAAAVTDPFADSHNPNYQWHLETINAFDAWDITMGDSGIKVAVLDTGIDLTHPEFNGQIHAAVCKVEDEPDAQDDNGHGTHVAGIIAAKADGVGSVGVAPDVQLIIVDVFGWYEEQIFGATSESIVEGIEYSVDNGAQVINMSVGSCHADTAEEEAVNDAVNAGVVCIAAAGNHDPEEDDPTEALYPSDFDACISVIATDRNDERASYSNYGTAKDISAPGGGGSNYIVSTYLRSEQPSGYLGAQGTSMASPVVAGVVALMLSANDTLTVDQVKTILYGTAVDLGTPGKDIYFGNGRVDAQAAVLAANSPHTITLSSSNTSQGTVSGGGVTFSGLKTTVRATPKSGYRFVGWYEGQTKVSSNTAYTFTVSGNRALIARFAHADYTFNINDDQSTATITGYTGSGGSITIPSEMAGYPVTAVRQQTFENNKTLTDVTIPSGVTTIGERAFSNCDSLSAVTFPESIEHIDDQAFCDCYLDSVYFEGNAPVFFGEDVFKHANEGFTIYYRSNKTGWTTPTWNGYKTIEVGSRIESSAYTIDRAKGYIKGVALNTSVTALKANLLNDAVLIKVYTAAGAEYKGSRLATGMVVKLIINGSVEDELSVVIRGDANGDGLIDISDYTLVRLDILELKTLLDAYRAAADVKVDGKVDISDYTLIRLDILELKRIH